MAAKGGRWRGMNHHGAEMDTVRNKVLLLGEEVDKPNEAVPQLERRGGYATGVLEQ